MSDKQGDIGDTVPVVLEFDDNNLDFLGNIIGLALLEGPEVPPVPPEWAELTDNFWALDLLFLVLGDFMINFEARLDKVDLTELTETEE